MVHPLTVHFDGARHVLAGPFGPTVCRRAVFGNELAAAAPASAMLRVTCEGCKR